MNEEDSQIQQADIDLYDLDFKIVHLNTAKRPDALSNLSSTYLTNQRNYLISINEPPANNINNAPILVNNFQHIIKLNDSSKRISAMILAGGPNIQICKLTQFTNDYCATAEVAYKDNSFVFVSIYFNPKQELSPILNFLQSIIDNVNKPIVIMSDTNSHNTAWNDSTSDSRGEELLDFMIGNDLIVANGDSESTFYTIRESKVYESLIDLCICNPKAYSTIGKCFTDINIDSHSDHRFLVLYLQQSSNHQPKRISKTTRRFRLNDVDWSEFQNDFYNNIKDKLYMLDDLSSKTKINNAIEMIEDSIITTCKSNLTKYTSKPLRKVPWFDQELKRSKTNMNTAYKRWRRSLTELIKQHNWVKYLNAKLIYKKLFNEKKRSSWLALCENVTNDNVYQVFRSVKPVNKSPLSTILIDEENYTKDYDQTIEHLIKTHFPNNNHPPIQQPKHHLTVHQKNEIQFTNDNEIYRVFKCFNPKKAPGSDGLSSSIIVKCLERIPNLFTNLFNSLMILGYFPDKWKIGVVCLIPKPNSTDTITAKSFRPVTLLKVQSKGFEKILNSRLIYFLHLNNKISSSQFGFTRQKSTLDACERVIEEIDEIIKEKSVPLLVSFDIQGAFDSAAWYLIIKKLKVMNSPAYLVNMISSYLNKRKNQLLGTTLKFEIKQGCPQGSCLGPTLWNVLINDLLESKIPRNVFSQAFADDLITISRFKANDYQNFKTTTENVIRSIFNWGEKNHLKFNSKKTQALLVTKRIKHPAIEFEIDDNKIISSDKLTYLGLVIDCNLNFIDHITTRLNKSKQFLLYLNRICAKTYGISVSNAMTLYKIVLQSMALYGCEIWAGRCNSKTIVAKLRSFQRTCAITVVKAWRTIRAETAIMLLGEMPLDYVAMNRHMNRMVQKFGNLNEQEVETKTNWLKYIPEWLFDPINQIEYDGEQLDEYDLRVSTDGSNRHQRSGSSFIIQFKDNNPSVQMKFRLPNYCSPFQAEIYSINQATLFIKDMNPSNQKIVFITDSQSVIQHLNNSYKQSDVTIEIRRRFDELIQRNNLICFCWVKSHSGIEINEQADQLAKEATELNEVSTEMNEIKMPLKTAKSIIHKNLKESWDSFLPDLVSDWSKHFTQIKNLHLIANFNTTQFVSAHGMNNEYRSRFKLTEDSSCPFCQASIESPQHILFYCPQYQQLREQYLHSNDIHSEVDLFKLSVKEKADDFKYFCKEVVNFKLKSQSESRN